jgi:hypothetical protein
VVNVTDYDGEEERQILTGMIVDRTVLGRISSVWQKGAKPFDGEGANALGRICVAYFRQFGKPPDKDIVGRVIRWHERNGKDKTAGEMMNRIVRSLSDRWEQAKADVNPEVLVEMAQSVFRKVTLRRMAEDVLAALDSGQTDKAEEVRKGYAAVELGSKEGSFLENEELWQAAFAEPDKSIVEYGSGLGEFFGHSLGRDSFFAFMAAEKRGKTWWLADLAWRAMSQQLRVAYFQAGDQSRNQIMRRFAVRAARRPRRAQTIVLPKGIEYNGEKKRSFPAEREEKTFDEPLRWREAYDSYMQKLGRIKSRGELFFLTCYGNGSLSVEQIKSMLLHKAHAEGWTADVVVVDYADILAAPSTSSHYSDERAQVNANWIALKNLSTELHCLVVTATQVKAEAYKADLLLMSHFSEDKRKYAHVDGMVGINVDVHEKARSACRLNWLVLRDDDFNTYRPVHCLGCTPIGNPAMLSVYPKWEPRNHGKEE